MISQKVLGFKGEEPCLYVSNENWAHEKKYDDNFRIVREDESLIVYGEVIGRVKMKSTLEKKSLLEKFNEVNKNPGTLAIIFALTLSIMSGVLVGELIRPTFRSLLGI